jgi:hypothetical protein
MRTARVPFAIVVAVFGILGGACAAKDATGPAIALSQEEVFGLAGELSDAMTSASVPLASGSFQTSADCANGGTVTISGSDTQTDASVAADVTFAFNGCRTAHYTTSGSLRITGGATSTDTVVTAEAAGSGSLGVTAADGRSGDCQVNLTVTTTVAPAGPSAVTVRGTACGVDVGGSYQ